MNVFYLTLLMSLLASCKPVSKLQHSSLKAEGDYSLSNMPDKTKNAIMDACNDAQGASAVGIAVEECYLIMAGSTVKESSWKPDKSPEAWGQEDNKCYGLTQSRKTDASAVGLSCDVSSTSRESLKCNVLTGLRNMGCLADGGKSCRKWSSTLSLRTGITKHLGSPNQDSLKPYTNVMKEIYERSDVRDHFGISDNIRSWSEILDAPYEPGAYSAGGYSNNETASEENENYSDYSSAEPESEESWESEGSFEPEDNSSSSSASTRQCGFMHYCWGFYSFKWFKNGESNGDYTCQCGIWKK